MIRYTAAEISTLWWVMLAGAAVIFLLVMGLLTLAFTRRGAVKPQKERVWILGGGLVFTTTVLVALLAGLWPVGGQPEVAQRGARRDRQGGGRHGNG